MSSSGYGAGVRFSEAWSEDSEEDPAAAFAAATARGAARAAGETPPGRDESRRRRSSQNSAGDTTSGADNLFDRESSGASGGPGMTEARANAMLASELKNMRERREARLTFIKLPEKLMEYPTWRQKAMSKVLACGLPGSITLRYIKQCNHWTRE